MPDTTWPIGGHPPGSSRDSRYIPVSMSPVFVSTRHQRFACARLPDPHLTHRVRLFPHRSPRQSSANAAVGGLKPPPAGRLRRAYLHLPRSTASRSSTYIKLLSAFVTHTHANDHQRGLPIHRHGTLPSDPQIVQPVTRGRRAREDPVQGQEQARITERSQPRSGETPLTRRARERPAEELAHPPQAPLLPLACRPARQGHSRIADP